MRTIIRWVGTVLAVFVTIVVAVAVVVVLVAGSYEVEVGGRQHTPDLTPNEDNERQTERMKDLGLFDQVNVEEGCIIVATVNTDHVKALLDPDRVELKRLIGKREEVE